MKTTMKRSVAILALAVLLALTATPLFAQAKKVVEIEVWAHWASEQRRPTINAMIEEFNRLYESKGIKAVYTPVAFDEIQKKLLAAIAAKDPPDVAISSIEEVTIRALKKRATDITKYLPKDLKDKYYSSLWEAVTYKGKVYALPFNTDNRFLFYNKKMFAEAGITTLPKTWAELLAIADKLDKKDASGAYTQYAFFPTLGNFGFDSFAYANGAFLFSDPMNPKTPTINSKANIEALEYMTKWRARYGADTYNTMTANLGSGINDLFISGKVAILGNVCNYIATLQRYAPTMDYGVMALPAGPSAKKAYTPGGGFVVEVPYGSKHVAEAAEFVKFMTGDWAASKWGLDQKDVMANIAANENPAMSTSPAWSLVKELLPVTQVTRRLATAPTASAIKDKWVDLVIKQGTEMPAAALNKAQEELLKTIKENEELGF